ncbi:MAG: sulfotransferase [Verrucomicrobiales bacterium]
MNESAKPKIFGIGLNKTGTKTMAHYFRVWGFRNQSFDLQAFRDYQNGNWEKLFSLAERSDTFEDWPWPLMFRELDERFPDARFILTVRSSPEAWFQSLCKMAVRMGPLNDFEKHVYGFGMPQGRKQEHIEIYESHNRAVEEHFRDRPEKLLRICWEDGDGPEKLGQFLGLEKPGVDPVHANRSLKVYSGNNLALAHTYRVGFQTWWRAREWWRSRKNPGGKK